MESRFNSVGGTDYDLFKMVCPHHDEWQEEVGRQVKNQFRNRKPIRLMDMGVGTGETTQAVLKYNPGAEIIAVDSELTMISQARERFSPHSYDIHYEISPVERLLPNLSDNFLDGMVSAYMLHNNSPEIRSTIFRESYRVLKPGGIFVLADKMAPDNHEQHAIELADQLVDFRMFLDAGRPDLFSYWMEHMIRDDQPDLRLTQTEVIDKMSKAGFADVQKVYEKRMERVVVGYKR